MPKDVIAGIIIILTVVIIGGIWFNYSREDAREQTLVSVMTEGVQTVAVKSIDNSSRVERNTVKIDQTIFEKNFKEYFKNNNNVSLDKYSLKFDYRKSGENVKAIRVTLTDDRGEKYPVTVAVDTKK